MSKIDAEKKTIIKEEEEYEEISLLKNPITTLSTLLVILYEQLIKFGKFLLTNKIILILGVLYLGLNFVDGPHKQVKEKEKKNLK